MTNKTLTGNSIFYLEKRNSHIACSVNISLYKPHWVITFKNLITKSLIIEISLTDTFHHTVNCKKEATTRVAGLSFLSVLFFFSKSLLFQPSMF